MAARGWWMLLMPLLLVSGDLVEDPRVASGLRTNLVISAPESQQPALHKLRKALLEPELGRGMQRVFLSDRRVTCNDGSPAGYYIRKHPGSRRWIIFLEGGMYCYDQLSCNLRWSRTRGLMSSHHWSHVRHAGGILSPSAEENPYWWNANHVLVPYCSSDSWSGAQGPPTTPSSPGGPQRFVFMGSYIVSQVVADLLSRGLANASRLTLAGSSAGGTGVLLNLDRVADALRRAAPRLEVRGLADSGWFLDRTPYPGGSGSTGCRESGLCRAGPATLALQQALRYWGGRVPEDCAAQYSNEHWKCFFGQSVHPTMRTPLFVFQWLFDEAQMAADNVGTPVSKQQWDFIHSMGDSLRRSLENVTAAFVPSCISHTVLTSRDWRNVRINHVSLPQALRCWELQPLRHLPHHHHRHHYQQQQSSSSSSLQPQWHRHRHAALVNATWPLYMLADAPVKSARPLIRSGVLDPSELIVPVDSSSSVVDPKEPCRRRCRQARKKKKQQGGGKNQRPARQRQRKGGRRDRGRKERSLWGDACPFRVLERCSWPQCNLSCPKLHNPFTGEELDFIELLKSFGLDMSSVAAALGIDLHTLHNMEHSELLNLLTQQAN